MVSRRWVTFALVVVVLAYGCYLLGRWQFHRLHDRELTNAQTRTNLAARPVDVSQVLRVGRPAGTATEWRRVTATGTYLAEDSVAVRYQTRDGSSGIDVVTPLRTDKGVAVLVDRGWVKTENVGSSGIKLPAPPPGRVSVVAFVRANATGSATTVTDHSTRAISSASISKVVDAPLYVGFVDAESEHPTSATRLVPVELPDLGNGPHFFYGLQWWFFGVLAVFGFGYLAYDERKKLHAPKQPPAPTDSTEPEPSVRSGSGTTSRS
jgi:cytochrome oxidase assembly protein ShyY1